MTRAEIRRTLSARFLREQYLVNLRSAVDIAASIGCSATTVERYLKRYGIPARDTKIKIGQPRHPNAINRKSLASRAAITEALLIEKYVVRGMTREAIAAEHGFCSATVGRALRRFGIPSRSGRFERGHKTVPPRVKTLPSWTGMTKETHPVAALISARKKGVPNIRLRGARHHNWKGGVTPEDQAIRNSAEYAVWRMAVYTRDNFSCVECGARGSRKTRIEAHHKLSFAEHPQLRLSVDNGITLCAKCHRGVHSSRRRNGNPPR